MANEHEYDETEPRDGGSQNNEVRSDDNEDFDNSDVFYGWDDERHESKCSHGKLFLIIAVLAAVAGYFFFKYRCASGQCSSKWCGELDRKQKQAQKVLAKTVQTAGSAVDDTTGKIRESVQQLLA
ncbi:MAG: hypothetical protein LKK45_06575 [Bifidobacterium psychraerophilum]|jgi:hypothetical protein|uniref:hypothetical protein n=1 Tax=Bifidobacterium psychraerophilum TaxID=218140 RepID=UPI0023F98D7D|nr:hypothetical protein [Bifidobacterium psychraerophilum]MCI1659696.1 hypothetical protein [Bifidobacterium psychraerophilum]MCI2176827.1 hypothetical protein [Bifidobacterium psychraerophilum]MCI2182587.1 hypothetical protein [Bifidobacterium psychraerophilum]